MKTALKQLGCGECGEKHIVFKEDSTKRSGLYTAPYMFCEHCSHRIPIPFTFVGNSKVLLINRKSVLANKCAGGTLASLQMLLGMLDLPMPVSKNSYTAHVQAISKYALLQAQASMDTARKEVRTFYKAESDDEIVDVVVSCDGTWQRRGFSSLLGAVFIICYESGKVLDFVVKSKFCKGCKHWEKKDKDSDAYKWWKENHVCDVNFDGSAGAMEPQGTLDMFRSSLQYGVRFKWLISDGDAKTHSLLLTEQPCGPDNLVEKADCVGHVQKRMGTALRNLKLQFKGQKLADGKTIGGAGRLTDKVINSLQNYYGDAIRRNRGDVKAMMKAVQATLLHCNSTNSMPRYHLCPKGPDSWCKWQQAQATGKEYDHKDLLPSAIVQVLRPIYNRLGSQSLLERCVDGVYPKCKRGTTFHGVEILPQGIVHGQSWW